MLTITHMLCMIWKDERTSQLPLHGGGKELGRGLVAKIKKDLGLDQ